MLLWWRFKKTLTLFFVFLYESVPKCFFRSNLQCCLLHVTLLFIYSPSTHKRVKVPSPFSLSDFLLTIFTRILFLPIKYSNFPMPSINQFKRAYNIYPNFRQQTFHFWFSIDEYSTKYSFNVSIVSNARMITTIKVNTVC